MPIEIIAEIGSNHNRDRKIIRELITGCAAAGAQIAKFQTFTAKGLYSAKTPVADYLKDNPAVRGRTTWEFVSELELPESMYSEIREMTAQAGLEFMSTPFGLDELAFLLTQGIKRIKIGSSEITNFPLLEAAAASGLPILLSTGMSTLADIEKAMTRLQASGARDITLMQCVVAYPAQASEYNLRVLETFRRAFGTKVGVSDHTMGDLVPLLSVALGAHVLEKHVTLDRSLPGPDHPHATTMPELTALCRRIREAESALGDGIKRVMASEVPLLKYRAGLVLRRKVPAGRAIERADIVVKRPAFGIPAEHLDLIVGRVARVDLEPETMLTWEMV